jgi:hypothetical protein
MGGEKRLINKPTPLHDAIIFFIILILLVHSQFQKLIFM